MFDHGLRDLGCIGSRFTWNRGGLSQRLDRAICNEDWELQFANCRVRNLLRLKSDHRPIFVYLDCSKTTASRLFRCMDSWMLHRDFYSLVQHNWSSEDSVVGNLGKFQLIVLDWNTKVYGNIFERKNILTGELTRM